MAVAWGVDLWDQEKAIVSRTDGSLGFLQRCHGFMRARAEAEMAYAKELRKLCKNHLGDVSKLPETLGCKASFGAAWATVLRETDDMAKQHEVIAEALTSKIVEPMKALAKEKRAERHCHLSDLQQLNSNLNSAKKKYEGSKKSYEKATKESMDVQAKFVKVDSDPQVTRAKVDKVRAEKRKVMDELDRVKVDHIIVTKELNDIQRKFVRESQASIFNALQSLEENLIQSHAYYLGQYGVAVGDVFTVLNQCLDNVAAAAQSVDATADTSAFASVTKTGNPIPEDIVVDVASSAAPALSSTKTVQEINERRVKKHKFFKTTSRKKDAVREDFGHLPPEQRKNAIKNKLAELEAEKARAERTIAGLDKTIELYTDRPELGDDKSLLQAKKELGDQHAALAAVEANLYKFHLYLAAIEGTDVPAQLAPTTPSRQTSGASMGSMSGPSTPAMGGLAAAADEEEEEEEEDEFDEQEAAAGSAPVIGQATALYSFAGTNDGELPITQDDRLDVHENDGSGWIRVSRDGVEGYVPTSYVKLDP